MSRSASGVCSRIVTGGYVGGTIILETEVNAEINDIVSMLTDSLSRDGDGGMRADLDLDGNAITNGTATLTSVKVGTDSAALGFNTGTGAGSTVTQLTSTTTSVTINKMCGRIITYTLSSPGSYANTNFTVNNSKVGENDTIILSCVGNSDTPSNSKLLEYRVSRVQAGSFEISLNTQGFTYTGNWTFNFAVIKAATD